MGARIYPKFKQALLSPGVDLAAATVRAVLIDSGAYAYSAAHEFLSSVPAGARYGAPQTLGSKTFLDGTFDAADVEFPAVQAGAGSGSAVEAVLLYVDTGSEATSRLVLYQDARQSFDVAAAAASGATSLVVEDLPIALASGATLTKVSGTGPTTITTTAAAARGDRALAVSALGSAVAAGAIYEASAAGSLPLTLNGSSVRIVWSDEGVIVL